MPRDLSGQGMIADVGNMSGSIPGDAGRAASMLQLQQQLTALQARVSANEGMLSDILGGTQKTRGFRFFTDFLGTNPVDIGNLATGTGAVSNGVTNSALSDVPILAPTMQRPGVLRANTGTTAAGTAGFASAVTTCLLGAGSWVYEGDFYLPQLSTSVEEFIIRIGFFDSFTSVDPTQGVWFEYNRVSSVNWLLRSNNGGTASSANSNVAVTAGTWVRYRIEITAGGVATLFLDNVVVGTLNTNMPTGSFRFGFSITKTAGVTARALCYDWLAVDYVSQTPLRQ